MSNMNESVKNLIDDINDYYESKILEAIAKIDDEYSERLNKIIKENTDKKGEIDPEGVHGGMDKAVEVMLNKLGLKKTAKLYAECPGWYS